MNLEQRLLNALQYAPEGLSPAEMSNHLAEAADCTWSKASAWYDEWLRNQEAQGDVEPAYFMGYKLSAHVDCVAPEQDADPINPSHYQQGNVECIHAICDALGDEQFKGYLRGNVMKYLWRLEHKGCPLENAQKGRWYLDRLINELEIEKECE